jgi:hypothetical protein
LRPEAKERNSKHTHSCEGEDLEEHLAQEQEQGGEEQQADLQKIGLACYNCLINLRIEIELVVIA